MEELSVYSYSPTPSPSIPNTWILGKERVDSFHVFWRELRWKWIFFKYIGTNEFVYTKKLGQGGLAGVGLASWLKLQGPM